jgi:protease I
VIVLAGFSIPCLGSEQSAPAVRRTSRLSTLKIVQLPEPKITGQLSFEEALAKQQSIEPPSSQRLQLAEIGQLAWAGQGVMRSTAVAGVTPPADEAYPVKLYFVMPEGVYLYSANNHTLQQVTGSDVRSELATAVFNQPIASASGCGIILAGNIRGFAPRYGNDARKVMLLQAGQMAQNIMLQAVGLKLGFTALNNFDDNNVKRICRLSRTLEPLYVIFAGSPAGQEQTTTTQVQNAGQVKKAVLIVPRTFREEELFDTKRGLELASVQTVIAGTQTGPIPSMLGGTVQAALPLNQVKVDEFDAVIFIGGTGAVEFYNSPIALNIARETVAKNKVLAAISLAPATLANAGVLKGVRATGFIGVRDRLTQGGAVYTSNPVERDNLIITATDPLAVPGFVRAILDALAGR